MNTLKKYKYYLTPQLLFGSSIFVINLSNYKKSPKYNSKTANYFMYTRIGCMSLLKGSIYSVFFPIGLIGIGMNLFTGDQIQFENHLIPFSKHLH